MNYQMLKEVKRSSNMILTNDFLKHIIMMSGLKMKLIQKKSNKEEFVDLSDIPALEDDEEVKEGKILFFLTSNKLLTALPILLAQIKAGNNSYKLKNEIRRINSIIA